MTKLLCIQVRHKMLAHAQRELNVRKIQKGSLSNKLFMENRRTSNTAAYSGKNRLTDRGSCLAST